MESEKRSESIGVQITTSFLGGDICRERFTDLVKNICRRFGVHKASVGIAIVSDEEIILVNKQFLKHGHTTDVISFDLSDEGGGSERIFELVVNGEKAIRESEERGHTYQAELALYITHGLLHQLGFDDSTKKQAQKMHETEDEILREESFGPVYNSQMKDED